MIGEAILFLIGLLYIVPLNNSLYNLLSLKLTSNILIDFLFLIIIVFLVLLIGLGGKYLLIRLDIDYNEYKVDKYMIGTSKIKGVTTLIIIVLILVSYYLGIINLNKIDIKVITLGLLIIWFLIISRSYPLEEVKEDKRLIIKEGDKINPLLKKVNKKKNTNINNINLVEEVSSIGLNKEEFIEDKAKGSKDNNEEYKSEGIPKTVYGPEYKEEVKAYDTSNKDLYEQGDNLREKENYYENHKLNHEKNFAGESEFMDVNNYEEQYEYNVEDPYKNNIEERESNEIEQGNKAGETYELSEEEIIVNNKQKKEAEKLRNYKEELIRSRLRLKEKQQRKLQEKRTRNRDK